MEKPKRVRVNRSSIVLEYFTYQNEWVSIKKCYINPHIFDLMKDIDKFLEAGAEIYIEEE